MARPTKLTKEKADEIIKHIKIGLYYKTACECCGVDYSTFRRWMQRGEREKSGKYCEFYNAVNKANSEAELRMVMNWQKHVIDDWKAAKEFLERRYPEHWARREKLEHTGKDGGAIEISDARQLLLDSLIQINRSGDDK